MCVGTSINTAGVVVGDDVAVAAITGVTDGVDVDVAVGVAVLVNVGCG